MVRPTCRLNFRSMSAMSASERDAALAAGSLAFLLSDWVEQRFDLPQTDLDDLSDDAPEVAFIVPCERNGAWASVRSKIWFNFETKGIRLFLMAENRVTNDAFSVWRAETETPYIFLNTIKSAEHNRFDIAHEIGHLVLHRHGGPRGRRAEERDLIFSLRLF